MTILYFGDFDPEYSRNRVIIKGLWEHGFDVKICSVQTKGLIKYYDLWKEYRKFNNRYDVLIVGYSDSRWVTLWAWILSDKKIVWDGFFSIYDSWVFDRKLVSPRSLKARWYWFLDWMNCKLADLILSDTDTYIRYLSETFNVPKTKFVRVLVGTDDLFKPTLKPSSENNFIVHFHGNFIPLQGVEFIIKASNILRHELITFQVIGDGQTYAQVVQRAETLNLNNIKFIPKVPLFELASYIERADICLGIFGDTPKTQRVIPNKAYEAIAMAKALISAETPAMRELFTDKKDILFCNCADSQDLAQKILELKNDEGLRNRIARGGYELYKDRVTPAKVVLPLIELLKTL